jgi:mannose-6-phosphate isomerase-like protein (cupin superfamily)
MDTIHTSKMAAAPKEFAGAEYCRFWEAPPQEKDENGRTWISRGQNFVVAYSDAEPGSVFSRKKQADEYVLLLPDRGTKVEVTAKGETQAIDGYSVTMIPPGDSQVKVVSGGKIIRLLTSRATDLTAKASNAASYEKPHPHIPAFETWPEPKKGYKIRSYSLDVPQEPGRFGRIFRCTTFMVNCLEERKGPRDVTRLSPHHHEDFEQCFLLLEGAYIFSMRWPWTPNMNVWREDEHTFMRAPSITVVPPYAIHTSRAQDQVVNWLCDCYSPPRKDFSGEAGWVLNADDYPIPD